MRSDLNAVHHVPGVETAGPPGLGGGSTGGGAGAPLGPLHLHLAGALLLLPRLGIHRVLLLTSAAITAS